MKVKEKFEHFNIPVERAAVDASILYGEITRRIPDMIEVRKDECLELLRKL